MNRLLGFVVALTLSLMLLLPVPAKAQTNATYQLTDSALAVHQVHGFQCLTSLLCLAQVPIDYTGAVFGVSANPFFVSGSGAFGSAIGSSGLPGGFKDTGGLFQPFLGDANGLWVNIKAAAAIGVTGTFWQATQPVSIASMPTTPVTGTFWPYTLGQQLAASSVPVVLTAAQLTALTPPAAITGFALAANQTNASQKTQIVDGAGNVIGSTSNNLNVQCANCSGSGVSTADNATWTFGTSSFAGTGGAYQTSVTSNPLTAGHQGFAQLTQYRALMTNPRDSLGNEILGIATQAHSCSIAGYTLLGCLGQIDDDAKGPLAQVTAPLNAATAVATSSTIIGAQYVSTQPTMTNTQQAGLLLSSRGELLVSPGASGFPVSQTGSPWQVQSNSANLATQTTLAAVLSALGSPFQAGTSIGNTSFGISGTLPGFASPPAFSLNATPSVANGSGVVPVPSSESAAAMSHASTTALGTSLVAKASAGNLYGYNCTGIAGGAAGYCIVYNGTSAPSTGALTGANVLDFCYFDTTARGCSLGRHPMSVNYSAGMVVLVSSAASPYTYTTGTDTAAISADFK